MALVSLKCPNCGGSLQIENTMEKGFCMYCGSSFMVKDEIQRIQVEHRGTVNLSRKEEANNIATLGRMKFEENTEIDIAGCKSILDNYVEKSLMLDITNTKALTLKSDVESKITEMCDEKQKRTELQRGSEEGKRLAGAIIIIFAAILGIMLLISFVSCMA